MQEKKKRAYQREGFFDWPDEPWCRGCRYYRPVYDHGPGRRRPGRICHYLLDEGRMRGCPFGAGCTRRDTGGKPTP